jgi:hypothetical protein
MNPLVKIKTPTSLLLIILGFVWLGLLPKARAVSPAPDGGYPGGNTAEGNNALPNVNTAIGINNTAVGANALRDDTTGAYNVAVGSLALAGDTTGYQNTAIGTQTLTRNNGNFNLAIGFRVGYMNTNGNRLTGVGGEALLDNTTGDDNTAIGSQALLSNTIGNGNTAVGSQAATGMGGPNDNNTAIGFAALDLLTHGNSNTAIGANALDAISVGGQNIAVGSFAGGYLNSGNNNIYIGSSGDTFDNDTIRIGDSTHSATYVAGIYGHTASSGIQVYINSDGRLGTLTSSRRFKEDVKPMEQASKALYGLKPVTFRYKSDSKATPQFGLIAEEVAEVNPDLVIRDAKGDVYTVRYDAVNAMLLNEFLKEHRKVQELEKRMEALTATVKEQAAQIQKVSAQLEMSKPAPQTVLNNQ